MWKNRTNWKNSRGGFANRRQGRQLGRRGQQQRRDGRKGDNKAGQIDKNYRQESRNFNLDHGRHGGSVDYAGIEMGNRYETDQFHDVPATRFDVFDRDPYKSHNRDRRNAESDLYRDYNDARRNTEQDSGRYDNISAGRNDSYWENAHMQEYQNRDQELQDDDFFGRRNQRDFQVDSVNRFERDFHSDRIEVRTEEQHGGSQSSYRDRDTHYELDRTRNWQVVDDRSSRHKWKEGQLSEGRTSFESRDVKDTRLNTKRKQDTWFENEFHSSKNISDGKTFGSRKGSTSKERSTVHNRSSDIKSSTVAITKEDLERHRRTESGDRNDHKTKGDSRHDQKRPEHKEERKSRVDTYKGNKSIQDRNSQKHDKDNQRSSESKVSKNRNYSSSKQRDISSDQKREEPKKTNSGTSRDGSSGFKKPLEKKHQSRQRSTSGRKIDSDIGHVHDEDILSIMADDDGFEREMKTDPKSSGKQRSSGSRERGSNASDVGRSHSRDSREREKGGKQNSDKGNNPEHNSSNKPHHQLHTNARAGGFGETSENAYRSSEFRSPTGKSDRRGNRQTASFTRNRRFGNRHAGFAARNNNYIGGRSGLSVASKIKDSYLKRRQPYQRNGNRGDNKRQSSIFRQENNRQSTNLVNVYNKPEKQTHGKNEIGKSGAILKDDRIKNSKRSLFSKTDNYRSSNFSDRNRSRSADNKTEVNSFDRKRNLPSFSFTQKQKFDRNSTRNRFQGDRGDRLSFKSRGSAYQRVKRKYFRGGFGKNGNNNRSQSDRKKGYNIDEAERPGEFSKRSVVDKNLYADGVCPVDLPENDQPLDPGQTQVIFIPNADLQSSQPQIVDQFGQLILSRDDLQQNENQVPIHYLPQQFHPDGEQVVFIPFVNNQAQPGYSEGLPLGVDEKNYSSKGTNMSLQNLSQTESANTNVGPRGKKPLSKQARARMRKYIELKKKQRMEKVIEQKVLRKLLGNPEISKVMTKTQLDEVKKKPAIKRITPPGPGKSNYDEKYFSATRKGNKNNLEDVSDDENKYDRVSDLEDVSDYEDVSDSNEEYGSAHTKRPGFRKPGQPRMRTTTEDASRVMQSNTSGDIRKVISQSSNQDERKNMKQMPRRTDNRRSVYVENTDECNYQEVGQKRRKDVFENKIVKKRRSISPIEITVSNDHYSKVTSGSFRYEEDTNDNYDSGKRRESYRSSIQQDGKKMRCNETVSLDRNSFGRNKTVSDRNDDFKGDANERKYVNRKSAESFSEQKYSNASDRSSQSNRGGQKYNRNERSSYSSNEQFQDKRNKSVGKYGGEIIDLTDEADRVGQRHERSHHKTGDRVTDERRHMEKGRNTNYTQRRRGPIEEPESTRYSRDSADREWISEHEDERSFSRERNLNEGFNDTQNIQIHDRHRSNLQNERMGRNISNKTFVSSMNQGQFQVTQPLMQQSMQPQTFMTSASQSVPMQFSTSSNVDHSLPPVQNSPISLAPGPPGLGGRPDMSLPPPIMNVVGPPTSMVIQQPNNMQFQQQPMHQVSIQQQTMQQQQFHNMQPQFQQHQQQFQEMPQQSQVVQQQQPNSHQFQSQQPVFQSHLQSNQQISLKQLDSGPFQQNQIMSGNRNTVHQRVNQQIGSQRQGLGNSPRMIQTSMSQQSYVAATQQQAVRGVLGRVRIAAPIDQVSRSPTVSRKGAATSTVTVSNYKEDIEEEDDDYLAEMLCSKCDKVFLSHEVMRRHGRWHNMIESNSKLWRCDQCEQAFASNSGYIDHMDSKHSRDSWNCSLCDMTFNNSSGLNKHVRQPSHKDLKVKFVCSLCPASFMVLVHLIQHKKENHHLDAGYSGLRKY